MTKTEARKRAVNIWTDFFNARSSAEMTAIHYLGLIVDILIDHLIKE